MWPLLQLIAKYTGFTCLTLLGGAPPPNQNEDFKISVVNFGETKGIVPQDFRAFGGQGFNDALSVFARFVAAVGGV